MASEMERQTDRLISFSLQLEIDCAIPRRLNRNFNCHVYDICMLMQPRLCSDKIYWSRIPWRQISCYLLCELLGSMLQPSSENVKKIRTFNIALVTELPTQCLPPAGVIQIDRRKPTAILGDWADRITNLRFSPG